MLDALETVVNLTWSELIISGMLISTLILLVTSFAVYSLGKFESADYDDTI